ncbi:MAG: hypothetical protein CTY38_01015 [Methylotenera sp.]|uniref:hypothetical protein n=1 Tax=Methylotenera sp. TaxID=2051956 RepID=UPI000D4220E0|nr:hypothetical protein [Methylotenera sp.]PPC84659.1 MAG: hypothetical protein CTY38_01015 [Methylotenera sp.]
MEHASISSKQMVKYGRMDAGFHIAVNKVSEKAEVLSGKISEKEALNRILALKTEDLKCLEPLTTGNNKPGRAEYIKAAETYPLIAYAIILENIAEIEDGAKKGVSEAKAYSENIKSMKI